MKTSRSTRASRGDEWALRFQALVDGFARWVRLDSAARRPGVRRFLIVQIDGLSARVLDLALGAGRVPHMARLVKSGRLVYCPMSVGLPTSTPAFQAAAMYGVHPDIPGFHYYDKRAQIELHFPRAGVASLVERAQTNGRRGILEDGACFGCVFTGGAEESMTTFARLLRPTRPGRPLLRGLLSAGLLSWVAVKCVALTAAELFRFAARAVAHPRVARQSAYRQLGLKIGFSVWVRQFFTLAVSADLYRGVRAIYVNYLDYDVFAHAFGPSHRAAVRALGRIDRSIGQLARIVQRLPDVRYDLYVCSDHGQTATRAFTDVSGGRTLEEVVRAVLPVSAPVDSSAVASSGAPDPTTPRASAAGRLQRFFNHGAPDSRVNGAADRGAGARRRHGIHVVTAGPNAFVYFLDRPEPLHDDEIERRHPGGMARLSREPGIGFVLVRSASGPVCWWRGRALPLDGDAADGPFADRPDRALVAAGIRDLMAMPSAGDLVIYGIGAPGGDVSFIPERGAHAGPSEAEMHTFILHPPDCAPADGPITHPTQLYEHFIAYDPRGATDTVAPETEAIATTPS